MASVPRNAQGSMCLLGTPLHRLKEQLKEEASASVASSDSVLKRVPLLSSSSSDRPLTVLNYTLRQGTHSDSQG